MYSLLRPNPRLHVRSLAVQAPARARPVYSLAPSASRIGRLLDLPGFWRFHPVPLPCSQTPAGLFGLTISTKQCSPHCCKNEDTLRLGYRGSITRLQYLLLTLQVVRYRTRMQSSLRGCWLGFAGRESNPLESNEWFPPIPRCFPHSQSYPGAIQPPFHLRAPDLWVILSPSGGEGRGEGWLS
jgi:hypothetical protein